MDSTNGRKPDSTTLFVSLSLSMLVLFVFLNTAVFPSKKLLRQIAPQTKPAEKAAKVGYPRSIENLVVHSLATGKSSEFEFEESSLLIDGRVFAALSDTGRTKKEELFAWLSDLTMHKNYELDVTCFFDVGAGVGLVSGLKARQSECAEAFAAGLDNSVRSQIHFYGRMLPPQLGYILDQHSLDAENSYVLTLTRAGATG